MANRTKLTLSARDEFLGYLRAGNTITFAARAIGMSRQGVYDHKASDPAFAAEWDQAVDEGIDVLEQEAKRRAVEGVSKPIVQGGRIVTDADGNALVVREYSDKLLEMLLKAKKPDVYRDNARIEHTGKDGGPIETRNDLAPSERAARLAALFNHVAQRTSEAAN
jgi:hypothetical protein